nr:hypothetical protein [Tanacetum cinerariifolium]
MVNWAEMEVETEGVEAKTGTTKGFKARISTTEGVKARTMTKYKGKEKVSKDASDVVETRRCIVEFDTESKYQSDDDSDYRSDKSVDYLSPSEDELIELRYRMKSNRKAKDKAKDKPDSEMNEPNKENSMPADNVREYEKSIGEHYGMLRSYEKAILDSNPGSTDLVFGVSGRRLGLQHRQGLTLMSDQHKGLIEAVKDVMPNAEHMQCTRHIYENFRKQYTGLEYRQLFWETSKASYPQLFNKIMDKIKSANPNAHKYLIDKNPNTWSRAFFEVDKGCESIENGFSECFNSMIVNVRHKPLLTMLEAIRVIVLKRMNKIRKLVGNGTLGFWHVIPAGGNLFEVRSGSEGFTVDEDMYYVAYHNYVKPVPCMNFWPNQSMYSTVLPPKPRKMPDRLKKKRIRAIGEGGSSTRVSKDVDVHRGPVRDEGASWTRGGTIGSRGRGGKRGRGGQGAGGSSGANGSIGRGAYGSGGNSVSRGKGVVGPEEQVQPQEQPQQPQKQPQQVALRIPSASILQMKLAKQGSSQNTALNLD